MLINRISIFWGLFTLVPLANARSSTPKLELDLGSLKIESPVVQLVEPGKYSIGLINKLPLDKYNYSIHVKLSNRAMPPIAFTPSTASDTAIASLSSDIMGVFGESKEQKSTTNSKGESIILKLYNAIEDLEKIQDENAVASSVQKLRLAILTATNSWAEIEQAEITTTMRDAYIKTQEFAQSLISNTTKSDYVYAVHAGQYLEVTVTRSSEGQADKHWVVTYTTEDRGRWDTLFGFTFIPDRDEVFFAQQNSNGTNFTISKQSTHGTDLKLAPALFFTWVSSSSEDANWSIGPTLGLGVDASNQKPQCFLGYQATFNQNICIIAGGGFTSVKRLNGQYIEGEIINSPLSETQLSEQAYKFGWFVSLAYRFSSKPQGF